MGDDWLDELGQVVRAHDEGRSDAAADGFHRLRASSLSGCDDDSEPSLLALHHRLVVERAYARVLIDRGRLKEASEVARDASDAARRQEQRCTGSGLTCYRGHLFGFGAQLLATAAARCLFDESARVLVALLTADAPYDDDDDHRAHRSLRAQGSLLARDLARRARSLGHPALPDSFPSIVRYLAAGPQDSRQLSELTDATPDEDRLGAREDDRFLFPVLPHLDGARARHRQLRLALVDVASAEQRREHWRLPELTLVPVELTERFWADPAASGLLALVAVTALQHRVLALGRAGSFAEALEELSSRLDAVARMRVVASEHLAPVRGCSMAAIALGELRTGASRAERWSRHRAATLDAVATRAIELEHDVLDANGPETATVLTLARLGSLRHRAAPRRALRAEALHLGRSCLLYDTVLRVDPANAAARRERDALLHANRGASVAAFAARQPGFATELASWAWRPLTW